MASYGGEVASFLGGATMYLQRGKMKLEATRIRLAHRTISYQFPPRCSNTVASDPVPMRFERNARAAHGPCSVVEICDPRVSVAELIFPISAG